MSNLSVENKKIIDALLAGYQELKSVVKAFFPDKLKIPLKNYQEAEDKTQSAISLVEAVLATDMKTKFLCLKTFFESALIKSCLLLKTNNLSTANNIAAVIKHPKPDRCARALIALNAAGILNEANRQAVATQLTDPASVATLLKKMTAVGLLTGINEHINRAALCNHPNPAELIVGIETLESSNLWQANSAQVDFDALVRAEAEAVFSTARAIITSQPVGPSNNTFFSSDSDKSREVARVSPKQRS